MVQLEDLLSPINWVEIFGDYDCDFSFQHVLISSSLIMALSSGIIVSKLGS